MNLAVDIGNSSIKIGCFSGHDLLRNWVWKHDSLSDLLLLATNQSVKNIIISSVAGRLPENLLPQLQARFRVMELDAETPLPVQNHYQTPQSLGKDRLAAVAGAYQMFPVENCLIIDAGTCITYDILQANGTYIGGNISPGLKMRLRAMHQFTANLPLIEPGPMDSWVGKSTETALRNGAQLGVLNEIEGYIAKSREEWGQINVILTGGDAAFFAKSLKSKIFVNHHLVLTGLNKILSYNVECLE